MKTRRFLIIGISILVIVSVFSYLQWGTGGPSQLHCMFNECSVIPGGRVVYPTLDTTMPKTPVPEPERDPVPEGTYVDKNTYVYSIKDAESYLNYTLSTPYLPEGTELEKIKISSDKSKATIYYSNGLEVKHTPMGINFNNTHYKLNPERGGKVFDFGGTFAEGYEIDEPNRPHYSTIIIHRDDRIYVRVTMETGLDELLKMIEPMDLNVPYVPYTPTSDYVMGAPEPEPIPEPEPPTNAITASIGYNSGISVAENELISKSSLTPAKFDNISKAKLGNAQLVLSDVRVRDNGDVHYVYGPPSLRITDDTSIREIYQSGALQIKTNSLVNKESTFDALANYFKDEVKYINNVPALIKEFDDGYELELYAGDDQVIIIGAKASLAELEQVVVSLGIENKGLNLKEYVVENWEIPQEPSLSIEDPPVEP